MQTESAEIEVWRALRQWLQGGEHAWLCTIVEISGSSPRPLGSVMACNGKGEVTGSLSGGCVEEDLLERIACGRLALTRPELCVYGLTAEENERLGLPCGGRLRVLVEPMREAMLAHIEEVLEALTQRRCVRREVAIADGNCHAEAVDVVEPLVYDEHRMRHTLGPRFRLLLVGAGQLAHSLAMLASMLDYRVTVCDPRPQMVSAWQGPDVELVTMMPDDFLRGAGVDRYTAIVTLTHDPRIDDMALMEALCLDAFYVGALGSLRTSAKRRERMRQLELSEEQISRLRAPVGLDIGSKRPLEIAIAIMAELIALQRGSRV